ncbi:hypothetical protein ACFCYF_23610 [Streptomyces chartreusis]|uniref:hypothetical protein n=1 Tax=Streptomyces chartreusis TaxID=1969 RepID=UPI0035D6C560
MTVMATIEPPPMEEVDDREEREKWASLLRCSAHLYRQRDRPESTDLELAVRLSRQALLYTLEMRGTLETVRGPDLIIDSLGIWVSSLEAVSQPNVIV